MNDERKTKRQLLDELKALRWKIAQQSASRPGVARGPDGEENFRALAENANDGILISQEDGRYVYANRRAAEITGYAVSELLRKTIVDLTHKDQIDTVVDRQRRRLSGKPAPRQYETVIVRRDGTPLSIELTAARTVWHGRPAGLAIIRDITDKKRIEEALRSGKKRYRAVVEDQTDLICRFRPDGTMTFVNQAYCRYFGKKRKELIGHKFTPLIPKEDRQRVLNNIAALSHNKPIQTHEHRVFSASGEIRWQQWTNRAIFDDNGHLVEYQSAGRDVTERRHAEEQLQREKEYFRSFVESLDDWVWEMDKDGYHTYSNTAVEKILGYKIKEVVGLHTTNLWPEADKTPASLKKLKNALRSGQGWKNYECRFKHKNGSTIFMESTAIPIFNSNHQFIGYRGVDRDITLRKRTDEELKKYQGRLEKLVEERTTELSATNKQLINEIRERKRAEQEQREAKEYLNGIINAFDDPIFVKDRKHRWVLLNDAACTMLGHTREALIGKSDYDFLPKAQADVFWKIDNLVFRTKKPNINDEEITSRGQIRTISTKKSLFVDSVTGNKFIAGIIRDITERKQAEQELTEARDRLQLLFDFAPEAYYLTDEHGRLVDVNRATEEISGYHRPELIGNTIAELGLLSPEDLSRSADLLAKNLRGQHTGVTEFTFIRKDGARASVEVTSHPAKIKGQTVILNIARNIVERKQQDKKLRENEELFRSTFEQAAVGMTHVALDGRFLRANQKFCDIVGYGREELLQRRFQDITHPLDLETNLEFRRRLLSGEMAQLTMEKRYIHKDGYPVWVYLTSILHRDPSGRGDYFISVAEEIGVRKWSEKELIQSEERLKILFDYAPHAYLHLDSLGNIINCNMMALKMSGYSREELIGKNILTSQFLPQEQIAKAVGFFEELARGRSMRPHEFTLVRKNAERLSVEVSAFPVEIAGQTQILFIAHDVTERSRRAQRLQTRAQLLDQLRKTDNIDQCLEIGCQAVRDAGLYQRAVLTLHNPKREITHLGQVGLDQRTVEQARKASPPDKALTKRMTDKKYQIGHSYFIPAEASLAFQDTGRYILQKFSRPDSEEAWRSGDELFVPLMSADGAIEGYLSVDTPVDGKRPVLETILYLEDVVDIVARKIHEIQHIELLRESAETAQALMNASTDSAILSDTEGHIIALNQAAAERFKRPMEELVGTFGFDLVPPDLAKERNRYLQQAIETKKPVRFKDQRGDIFFDTIMYPIRDVHGKVTRVAVFGRDITAEVQAQRALESSEQRYRELVELLPQTVFEVDAKGNFISSNPAGFELSGYSQEDIDRGLNVQRLFVPEERTRALQNIAKVLQGHPFEDHQYNLLTKNDRRIPVLIYSSRIMQDDKPIGLRGVVLDISPLKQAEETLRQSENLARTFLNAYGDPAVLIDHKGIILDMNSDMVKRLGKSKERLIGTKIYDYFESQLASLRRERTQEAIRSRNPVHFEEENRGTHYETTVYPVVDTAGRVHQLAVFARNITERKKLADELRESEEKFRGLAENLPDAIFQTEKNGRIGYISPAIQEILGYQPQECVGKMFHTLVSRKDIPAAIVEFNKVIRGNPVRIPRIDLKRKDGSSVSVAISSKPAFKNGQIVGDQGIIRDISEHLRDDEAVRASEEKYRTIVELAPDAIITADSEGIVTSCNVSFLRQFGLREDDILNRHFTESPVMPKENRKKYRQLFASLMRGPAPKKSFEVEWVDQKGHTRHIEMHVGFLRSGRRKIGLQAILRDITERKRMEQRLCESELTYRSLVQMAPDSIVTFDRNGVITSCNSAALKVLGWTSEKRAIGKHFSQLPHLQKADVAKMKALFAAIIAGKDIPPVEFATRRKDGSLRWAEGRYSLLKDNDRVVGVQGIFRDITERKRQEMVQQSLCRISEAVHISTRLDHMYKTIHQELSAFLQTRNLSISLYDRENDTLSIEYHVDEKDRFQGKIPAGKTLTAYMIKKNRPLLITHREISELRRIGQVRPIGAPPKVWLGVPLRIKGKAIGALVVNDYRDEKAFDQADLQILDLLSDTIALSIQHKRTEDLLKSSETLFRTMAEHSPHMIYVNKMGSILFANKQCQQVFGYSQKHFYSPDFDFLNLIAPESRGLIKRNYRLHRQGKEIPPYECVYLTQRGKRIRLHCRTQLITYHGQPAIMGILSQMT